MEDNLLSHQLPLLGFLSRTSNLLFQLANFYSGLQGLLLALEDQLSDFFVLYSDFRHIPQVWLLQGAKPVKWLR